ncbi:MAG: glycosyltransferase [Candidatus Sericytochromatia bacterium]|nr:glycosyltransferase [Candidatus Sericytochromatia bacterium]
MKRLLLITYNWPPRAGVGLTRPWKWATFLPRYGWEVVVLTPEGAPSQIQCDPALGDLPGVEVLPVPFKTWRRQPAATPQPTVLAAPAPQRPRQPVPAWKRLATEILATPDDLWPWYGPAVAAARQRLAQGDIHAIVSTSPPETVHLIAHRLQRDFQVPWVADMRDLWSLDHFRARPPWKLALMRAWERRLLNRADGLTTVSADWIAAERQLLQPGPAEQVVIPNGFDPEAVAKTEPTAYAPFTVLYSGKLHGRHQDPRPFLEAVAKLHARHRLDARQFQALFYLYGSEQPDLVQLAASLGISDLIRVCPPVDPQTILAHQCGAHVLLLVHWLGPNRQGWFSAKVYDYLGAGRPILCQGDPDEAVCRMLTETGAGFSAPDAAGLAARLDAWFTTWQQTGSLPWSVPEAALAPYTRQHGTAQLAGLLDRLTIRA